MSDSWVYSKDGKDNKVVCAEKAAELIATGDYADHPNGPFGKGDKKSEPKEAVKKVPATSTGINKIDWPNVQEDDVSKDLLIAKAVDLGMDPPDNEAKPFILAMIKKAIADGAKGSTPKVKKKAAPKKKATPKKKKAAPKKKKAKKGAKKK